MEDVDTVFVTQLSTRYLIYKLIYRCTVHVYTCNEYMYKCALHVYTCIMYMYSLSISLTGEDGGILLDYSKNVITEKTMQLLFKLVSITCYTCTCTCICML